MARRPQARREAVSVAISGVILIALVLGWEQWTNHVQAQINHNEWKAHGMLKQLHDLQGVCHATPPQDPDLEWGAYLYLAEMGARELNAQHDWVREFHRECQKVSRRPGIQGGVLELNGYYIQVWLPGPDGQWIPELPDGGRPVEGVDGEASEKIWCAFAWPVEYGFTGKRAFTINEHGDALSARNDIARYSGSNTPHPDQTARYFREADPAFTSRLDPDALRRLPWGIPASHTIASDGERWFITP